MQLQFTKMQALGNDFIVIDGLKQAVNFTSSMIVSMADRHKGIGCDQVLLLEKSQETSADFIYRIYNADGSEVSQCGNGARAVTKFIHDKKLFANKTIRLKTKTSFIVCSLNNDGSVTVNMGKPESIKNMTVNNMAGVFVSVGNPHIVFFADDIQSIPINNMGKYCNDTILFPDGVNVGFVQIINQNNILLRVYERGAGETQACGSGACAAMIAGRFKEKLEANVNVKQSGGLLSITCDNVNHSPIFMTGPAEKVFEGVIEI